MNRVLIAICSSPDSKRLTQKCFLKIAGKPALQHIIDRVKGLGLPILVAVPDGTRQLYRDKIDFIDFDVKLMEGDPESPLHRLVNCLAELPDYDYIVRITNDDIIIDLQTIKEMIEQAYKKEAGYVFCPGIVEGAGVEIIATENLRAAAERHQEPVEHISYFVKGNMCPNPVVVEWKPRRNIARNYRLTLDYYEDYVVLESILRHIGADASTDTICKYLDMNASDLEYNRLPEVSFYTCVKDGERWIDNNLLSIPTGIDYEHIVIDDCSMDNTLSRLIRLSYRGYKIFVNQCNIGLASSSNVAVSKAKGKYVMRIDADDILKGYAVDEMKSKLENDESVICYANYDEIDAEGRIIRENVDAREKHHAGCALVNKKYLNELRFKEGLRHWDGLELYNRIIKHGFPVSYANEPLWYYRVHSDSMSNTNLGIREKLKP